MHMRPKLFFLLLLYATTALAEQMYVDDKLVLNVYAEADSRSSRIATIRTGDAVEALERVDKFVRVQLADGREGWVGASYLSTQPPAMLRLKELQGASGAATSELTDEIARLKKRNTTLEAQIAALKKQAAKPPSSPQQSTASATPVNAASAAAAPPVRLDVEPLSTPDAKPTIVIERSYWWAWALAVLAAGGAGFVAGYETLGRRVRQRFGGVKVY